MFYSKSKTHLDELDAKVSFHRMHFMLNKGILVH